jgi:hypothetical protein
MRTSGPDIKLRLFNSFRGFSKLGRVRPETGCLDGSTEHYQRHARLSLITTNGGEPVPTQLIAGGGDSKTAPEVPYFEKVSRSTTVLYVLPSSWIPKNNGGTRYF